MESKAPRLLLGAVALVAILGLVLPNVVGGEAITLVIYVLAIVVAMAGQFLTRRPGTMPTGRVWWLAPGVMVVGAALGLIAHRHVAATDTCPAADPRGAPFRWLGAPDCGTGGTHVEVASLLFGLLFWFFLGLAATIAVAQLRGLVKPAPAAQPTKAQPAKAQSAKAQPTKAQPTKAQPGKAATPAPKPQPGQRATARPGRPARAKKRP